MIAEHRPNGGLFMAATRDRFDVDDPVHISAARDIVTAIRPFNEWAVAMGYRESWGIKPAPLPRR